MENETHKNLSEEVLAEIQKKHLTPRSKWRVFFHDYVVWMLSVAALLLGSVSFSLFLAILFNNDWDIYPELGQNGFVYGLSIIPYLWMLFVVIFYFYAKYAFDKTETGYRYRQSRIIVGSMSVGILLGTAIYFSGLAQNADDYLVETVPYYHKFTGDHRMIWSLPDHGLLAGTVATTGPETFYLKDFDGRVWLVTKKGNETKLVTRGMKIKIIGEATGSTTFEEKSVRPWVGAVEGDCCLAP